jgi:two-component system, chemotaxis family, CheB/CheR fusion protein
VHFHELLGKVSMPPKNAVKSSKPENRSHSGKTGQSSRTGRKTGIPAKTKARAPVRPARSQRRPVTRAARATVSQPLMLRDKRPGGMSFSIVGIGASAGGFEAFTKLLSHLPADTGMAFVLVQHLDPTHESKLTELLQRSTAMRISEVTETTYVEPNRIYVMPPNANLTLVDHQLHLAPRRNQRTPQMPIDTFFKSLASQQQTRAIGIVLSGMGSDGSLGLEAIKAEGGITIAQDEKSAKCDGMPGNAIARGCVDFVLSPEAIAGELDRIARHPYPGPATSNRRPAGKSIPGPVGDVEALVPKASEELSAIFELLQARTGVDFSLYKHSTLQRRIIRRMLLRKYQNLGAYVRDLQENIAELDALFNDLLINVTGFFRDGQMFQMLKRKVLPKLLKNRAAEAALRLWVCGCSTGEEAYSFAICLVEFLEGARKHLPVQIFATDISEAALAKARAGVYPENILTDVPSERLRRFFVKIDGQYQVVKSIRDLCIFSRQNVVVDPPFSNLDLISCRNVLIYLGPSLQRRVLPIFHYALRPSGVLVLGGSEGIGASTELFALIDRRQKFYAKKVVAHRSNLTLRKPSEPIKTVPPEPRPGRAEIDSARELDEVIDELILNRYSPSAVIINEQMEVLQFRGRTGAYLEHGSGAASLNLLKMAREGLGVELRTAIYKALKQNEQLRHECVWAGSDGLSRDVVLEVLPFRLEQSGERLLLVVFEPVARSAEASTHAAARKPGEQRTLETREIAKLRQHLESTKESLQAVIEEQETTNEELKSANEEVLSSNEELQSTNEEMQTAREELQSTNEELTTLNEELQNRNNELNLANNDLTNLLTGLNVAVIILGDDLKIRRFTPMAEKLFNLVASDVGRRLGKVSRTTLAPDLEELARGVMDKLSVFEREVQGRDGIWYCLRIRPYRTRENKIEGVLIHLAEIGETRGVTEIMEIVDQPILALHSDLRVQKANQSFYRTFRVTPRETENRFIFELGNGQWNIPKLRTLLVGILSKQTRVDNFCIEANFPNLGRRSMLISARRFYEEGRGPKLIVLTIQAEKPANPSD